MIENARGWRPPRESLASRRFNPRSQGSARVFMTTPDGRKLILESGLEGKVAPVLLARRDVETLIEQPKPVTYRGIDGNRTQHTFDFLAIMTDRSRWMVAVKPSARATDQFRNEMEHLARQVSPAVARGVLIMTELDVPTHAVSDALLLNSVLNDNDVDAYERLARIADTIAGSVTIRDLAAACPTNGFRAVVRLIAEGMLERVDSSPLTPDALVKPAMWRMRGAVYA